ncbi:hypothetical protein DMX11_07300 [Pseudomonas sp. LB-090624]|nr:hypothetical protein DMX11_07300 [Pseudomonas sp. LB-090624]
MLRLQYEALARGIWLLYAATDRQVETLASPLSVISEQAAKKMPMFSEMLKEIHRTAPAIPSKMLQSFKDVNYQAMNSYVHSGIHPLRRHSEGYPEGLVRGVVTSSNGLSVMALQLGLILTGDSRLGGLVQEIQMDYSDLLPEIISPLH